jgi:hypothetical protein
MNFKKKAIIGIAAGLFAVATVFNMSMLNEKNSSDVSLDAVSVMAEAQSESFGRSIACWKGTGPACVTCDGQYWAGYIGAGWGC